MRASPPGEDKLATNATAHVLQYCRGNLLDRATRYIDDRPATLGKLTPRVENLLGNALVVDIIGLIQLVQYSQPVAANLDETLRTDRKADKQRL